MDIEKKQIKEDDRGKMAKEKTARAKRFLNPVSSTAEDVIRLAAEEYKKELDAKMIEKIRTKDHTYAEKKD